MTELDAKELIELLNGWQVNNEKGATVLYGLSHGEALEDIPVQDMDEALEEALEAISLLMNILFSFDIYDEGITLRGTYVTEHTFNNLLELRVRVENLRLRR